MLDGLWFLEVEKKFGFDNAYEIDKAVWITYARKEARKVKAFLGIEVINAASLEQIFGYLLFNQSLQYTLTPSEEDPHKIRFDIQICKTYEGMQRVGQSDEEIPRICYGIGMAYYRTLLSELSPGTEFVCIKCPQEIRNCTEMPRCTWEITLPADNP